MKVSLRAAIATAFFAVAAPQTASAMICTMESSESNETLCKIRFCMEIAFADGQCGDALALAAFRAFTGQSPIPIPPSECACTWLPFAPFLIATDILPGEPGFIDIDVDLPGAKSMSTYDKAAVATKVAENGAVNNSGVYAFDEPTKAPDQKFPIPSTDTVREAMKKQLDTNCTKNSFKMGIFPFSKTKRCYMNTAKADMKFKLKKRVKGWRRKVYYDFTLDNIVTDNLTPGAIDRSITEFTVRKGKIRNCDVKYFVRGVEVKNLNDTATGTAGSEADTMSCEKILSNVGLDTTEYEEDPIDGEYEYDPDDVDPNSPDEADPDSPYVPQDTDDDGNTGGGNTGGGGGTLDDDAADTQQHTTTEPAPADNNNGVFVFD